MGGSRDVARFTNVIRRWTVPANPARAAGALAAVIATSPAAAQPAPGAVDTTARSVPPAAVQVGATVVAPSGDTLGKIEHVLSGADGGARQVLVRTGGVARVRSSLKAIPAAGLTPKGPELAASLTREELQALPDVDAPQPTPGPTPPGPAPSA